MKEYRKFIWESANTYLAQKVDMEMVRQYMIETDFQNPSSMTDIYYALLSSLKNRQGMPNSIGDISRFSSILCNFDPLAVYQRFCRWEELFDAFQQSGISTSRMDKANSHNYWVIFCKGCLSAAKYLSKFDASNDFLEYVSDFDDNPNTRPALPLLLEYELYGIGFALACDFLKEIGFVNYPKPDIHLKDIFCGLKLSDNDPLAIFESITLMASEVKETPYAVDKLFWLIGSGRLYNHETVFSTNKSEFVKSTTSNWDRLESTKRDR